ncbi:SET6 (YPL165C) [Zygosaccharomyces parabailii]|uniref:ZYBA0S09-04082g1_1 n=1 Tax=Zygosaccharomyces bailii (strain CLIB 213 / ATCC 58445 / CBS 680 / BCRC 21525 / NBRC 1098 / NCYC 1416 / NRRL Y-2227) TaxID=1333698 RepID=A0A8J2X9T0_ZYGB2|nr:SET6 (YPL165C) [Zygosaccharomyces parabailii]CDF91068.1 ZYBA0S09-04082g1_1 [Zygosaccharomyces bailii CLIB 213]SJM86237.1 related to Potential protein lysine methyltransferase SET6 [Zygosaccharomyces bailii]
MGPISEFFSIQNTEYGGRACFSNTALARGTVILDADECLGESISYEFRKEICHFCFLYNYGKKMKWRIGAFEMEQLEPGTNWKGFRGAGLWFCSQQCRDAFLRQEHVVELIQGYENLLHALQITQKSGSPQKTDEQKLNSFLISSELIDRQWEQLQENWIKHVLRLKPNKRILQCPHITEETYCCARSVCTSLFQLKHLDSTSLTKRSFDVLQSNELSKISRFPILLSFQIAVYQVLYILLPPSLHSQLSVPLFRHIMGTEYGNAFGIWQAGESIDDREYLGYRLIPQASFFNHSCDPNIDKIANGRKMSFILNRDVQPGTQLCIAYNCNLKLPVADRRHVMKENWFFDCLCEKCSSELQTIHKCLF